MNGFRYYMHDGSAAFRFELSGNLSRESTRDLAQAWLTASSMIDRRSLIIDLSHLTGVDDAGRELLDTWHSQGARLVAIGSEATVRVQSMVKSPVVLLGTNRKVAAWRFLRVASPGR